MIVKKKITIMVTTLALILCFVVGGTLAWLVDKTSEVKNTFTYGDINIELNETTTEYKMIPGVEIAKDPTAVVKANSEACWLFVKVEESENLDDFIIYTMESGWTALGENYPGVYYREVANSTADQSFVVIGNNGVDGTGEFVSNKVLVKDSVTKEMLTAEDFTKPTLTFTAYAVQKEGFTTAAAAWAEATK